ncbi:hypothetical protein PT974_07757 [Cladobotryum mycophilum]|uniref:Peptidase A1 domain-containing protein n=1 Tax=Cladobotryum mycophilum TaxID=491253 RepID=A0ABR0SHS9_9HYPO
MRYSAFCITGFVAAIAASSTGDGPPPHNQGRYSIPFEKRATPIGKKLAVRGNTGDLPTVPQQWWMRMYVGTPPQELYILPDTGSGDFTIESDLMDPSIRGTGPIYSPGSSSSSFQVQGYTYSECYGSGYCDSGVVYTDVVTLGSLAVPGVPIQVENNATDRGGSDTGNVGLSFGTPQAADPRGVSGFLWSIRSSLDAGVFTVEYDESSNAGVFEFGYVNPSKFTGDMAYAPLDTSSQSGGEWITSFSGFIANGTFWVYSWKVILDTGTGGSSVPRLLADYYFSQVPGHQWNADWNQYQYPCSEQLPDLIIGIGSDAKFTIPGHSLFALSLDGTNCLSKLGVGDDGVYMFGENLMETLFIVFDFDNAQMGFGQKATSGSSPGTGITPPLPAPEHAGSVS